MNCKRHREYRAFRGFLGLRNLIRQQQQIQPRLGAFRDPAIDLLSEIRLAPTPQPRPGNLAARAA